MRGNDGSGNTVERDNWETPDWLFNQLNEQYQFDYDCCADSNNTKCNIFSNDFLSEKLGTTLVAWMNPPFSKATDMFEHFFEVIEKGIAIYRCDNLETKIWQEVILKNADWIFIPKGRIAYNAYTYSRSENKGTRFPSALIGLNVYYPKNLEGKILIPSSI